MYIGMKTKTITKADRKAQEIIEVTKTSEDATRMVHAFKCCATPSNKSWWDKVQAALDEYEADRLQQEIDHIDSLMV